MEDAASRVSFSRHTVYYHFRKWRIDGRLRRVDDRLREAVREREGRDRDPSATVIDSQVVKTTPVGGPERGYGGAKRLSGRKRPHPGRHRWTHPGGADARCGPQRPRRREAAAGRGSSRGVAPDGAPSELLWADRAYTGGFREWLRRRLG